MNHIGRQIGRYRILELLGSGGMSVVYKGLDTTLEREVAVKVLHPHLAGKEESRQRLAREARAVARLHHPNILEIFDYSDTENPGEDNDAYLVTEYIRGKTLRAVIDERPIGLPEIGAMIVHTLASALAQAHATGIIHRDLKPENVMVRDDGVIKVMDFGIAKLLDRDERMTVTGALVGSPAHMAPEIIEGLEATAASDVFSLGTIFFSLVTGKLPFTASNATATLKRILDGVYEDPRQLCPSVSDALTEIIGKSLARQPTERFAGAAALRDALGGYLAELGITHVPEALAAYFADPDRYSSELKARLVDVLLARGESLLAEGRQARALGTINHVLALDHSQPRALALLDRMNAARTRQLRRRQVRRAAMILGGVALLAAGASLLKFPVEEPPDGTGPGVEPSGALPSIGEDPSAVVARALVEASADPTTVAAADPPGPVNPTDGIKGSIDPVAVEGSMTPITARRPWAIPITVLVRPYGRVQIDGKPPTPAMLARHQLRAVPGTHKVRITCDLCEDMEETIQVVAGSENLFHLPAQPKASPITFTVEPPDATVRIGGDARVASATQLEPFIIRPARGATSFQYQVEAEISSPGYGTERHVVQLQAGRAAAVSLRLRPDGTARSP